MLRGVTFPKKHGISPLSAWRSLCCSRNLFFNDLTLRWFSVEKKRLPGVERVLEHYETIPTENIRNFCIVAHIDHGKSTLADKILEIAGNISPTTKMTQQVLDTLNVERERGITVKAQTATMVVERNGTKFLLNLIDTPGHVDFAFEVYRSLVACNGALVLIDSTQGVQAQTVANYHAAQKANLAMIPVLTKIDLPHADPEPCLNQIESALKLDPEKTLWTSAKAGEGVEEVIDAVIERVPSPVIHSEAPLKLFVFDSWFDRHRGVVCLVQVVDGKLAAGMEITSLGTSTRYTVQEVGMLCPQKEKVPELRAGLVGYMIAGMKSAKVQCLGDTFTETSTKDKVEPVQRFEKAKPMVFASLYPSDDGNLETLETAVDRLLLNDPSVTVQRERSTALGFGLRCGFLGLLHMDVFNQRLQDEFDTPVIITSPMVPYRVELMSGEEITVEKPGDFPLAKDTRRVYEPLAATSIVTPQDYIGPLVSLLQDHRGEQDDMVFLDDNRVLLKYTLPWQEVVTSLYDRVKSVSAGYASFDYEPFGEREADIVKVDILLNGDNVDALSFITHRTRAVSEGRRVAEKLKSLIKRQQFEVRIQAATEGKIFAREKIPAYRKDVLTTKAGKNVGGGDVTRKKKLLEKQKKGKARMRQVGKIQVGQEAFLAVISK